MKFMVKALSQNIFFFNSGQLSSGFPILCEEKVFFKEFSHYIIKTTYFWACWVVFSGNEQSFLQADELLEGIQDHLDDLSLQVYVPLPWPPANTASLLLTDSKTVAICHGHSYTPLIHAVPLHLTVDLKPYFFHLILITCWTSYTQKNFLQ